MSSWDTHFPIYTFLPRIPGQWQKHYEPSDSQCSRKWASEDDNQPRPGKVPRESPKVALLPSQLLTGKTKWNAKFVLEQETWNRDDLGFSEPFFLKEGLHSCIEDWTNALIHYRSPPYQNTEGQVPRIERGGSNGEPEGRLLLFQATLFQQTFHKQLLCVCHSAYCRALKT